MKRSATEIRHRVDTEFEARCVACRDWWPLTTEFWWPARGMRRCRACQVEHRLAGDRARYRVKARAEMTPEQLQRRRETDNASKARARQDPARRAALLERQRQTQRRWFERHREEALAARRAAYVERVGHPPKPGIGRPRIAA